ncbi:Arf-GAP with SH3 domain, ANK repeat and PH domain-containing protein 1 [Sparganum proliferum]
MMLSKPIPSFNFPSPTYIESCNWRSYLKECVCVMEHFGKSMPDLANRISLLQRQHDAQKRRLVDTRENVRRLLEKEPNSTSTALPNQPLQINPAYGTRKSGFLLKKSDGKVSYSGSLG